MRLANFQMKSRLVPGPSLSEIDRRYTYLSGYLDQWLRSEATVEAPFVKIFIEFLPVGHRAREGASVVQRICMVKPHVDPERLSDPVSCFSTAKNGVLRALDLIDARLGWRSEAFTTCVSSLPIDGSPLSLELPSLSGKSRAYALTTTLEVGRDYAELRAVVRKNGVEELAPALVVRKPQPFILDFSFPVRKVVFKEGAFQYVDRAGATLATIPV